VRGIYYVREKDLWNDVLKMYRDGEFPQSLATNMDKMTRRIVGSRRFDSCSDLLREEMVSRAFTHVCLALWEKKFDPKHGSRVYSWASRVILNECLKAIQDEQRLKKSFQQYANEAFLFGRVEIVAPNP
jgi:hypothetical protein